MAFDFPNTPANGDVANGYTWDGEKWAFTPNPIIATPSNVDPFVDGTANPGVLSTYSRGDHVHPSDPSKLSKTANLGDVENVVNSRKSLYAAPFDAMAYSGMQINGSFEVSQELGSTGTSAASAFVCDGWKTYRAGSMVFLVAQVAYSMVAGLSYSLQNSVSTAQPSLGAGDVAQVYQSIEGYRIARLGWGTAAAQPITLAFWTQHHRPGLYSGVVMNGLQNRSYAFTYTQAVADTREYHAITIPGDTLGTWDTGNTAGMVIVLSMGAGASSTAPSANNWLAGPYNAAPGQVNAVASTSDAFRLAGFIVLPGIEAPSAARSPLIMRPYDQELLTCMRYWRKFTYVQGAYMPVVGASIYATNALSPLMRATPTIAVVGTPIVTNVASINRFAGPDFFDHELTNTAIGGVYWNGSISLDARL